MQLVSTLIAGASARLRRQDARGVAAMEFAMVAPIVLFLVWGVWDITRALLAWEETYHAAEAIAQAAEKMSVTTKTQAGSTQPLTMLTAQNMQDAMTTIYAEMPWLHLGDGTGLFLGHYQVTLSGVSFDPTCPASVNNACGTQTPTVLWSSYLTLSGGGGQLATPPLGNPLALYRLCGPLVSVAQFPNNGNQLFDMINPNKDGGPGAANMILIPQVVADVVYTYTPSFPLLSHFTYNFYASATFPAPLGGDDQQIVFDQKDSGAGPNVVENCVGGNAWNG